jgi:hypothetical protein
MKSKKSILAILFVVACQASSWAQCAMCKATAESASQSTGGSLAEGLNSGILYLMLIPYILLLSLGLLFFRKRIANFFRAN